MPAPRTKRPFAGAAADASQRQITSYFTADDAPSVRGSASASHTSAAAVRLPASVQADLLSVGMRVRKSVPEGYKTGAAEAVAGFKLWSDEVEDVPACGLGGAAAAAAAAAPAPVGILTRELLPFCGINRETVEDHVEPPTPSRSRKRFFTDNDDDDAQDEEGYPGWMIPNARVKATPRSRASKGAHADDDPGQENMMVDGDFGEADFLVYGAAEQDMDVSR
ncbi:Ribonucleotide reductase inhibitor [Ophiocordyceps camponoti-floridani]|uniref:Ribonucleotide reductase inhibitor n=1 Tax=Ophiocordyceps camponoti-floridani TaxID=2030778 RepID=A0A8H4Q660_9HYPO|nr:Ribonucleotide reductase inhibitor [Ophiocordyceps camponoti-floridani]